MRSRYWCSGPIWLALALGCLSQLGCAKHRWLAREGQDRPGREGVAGGAGGPRRGDTLTADSTAVAGAEATGRSQRPAGALPDDLFLDRAGTETARDRPDPVASGGMPIDSSGERVSAELPWDEPGAAVPALRADDSAATCDDAPCYWVQVAAKLDTLGCGRLLAQALQVAAAGAASPGGETVLDGNLWKVRVGPYSDWLGADAARRRLRQGGFPEAWLVRR